MERPKNEHAIYSPLKEHEFRLVRFVPGRYRDLFQPVPCFKLTAFDLRNKPEYIALSYCWTKQDPSRNIYLNEHSFSIRPNLYAYVDQLHGFDQVRLRRRLDPHGHGPRIWWWNSWTFIDALCINQDDVRERGHQVRVMEEIYSGAAEVVAWLGMRLDHNVSAVGRTSGLKSGWRYHFEPIKAQDWVLAQEDLKRLSPPLQSGPASTRTSSVEDHFDVLISMFIQRGYWSRVWIVQEIVLARRLTILFRGFHLGADLLTTLIKQLDEYTAGQNMLLQHEPVNQQLLALIRNLMSLNSTRKLHSNETPCDGSSKKSHAQSELSLFSAVTDYSGQLYSAIRPHIWHSRSHERNVDARLCNAEAGALSTYPE